MRISFIGSGNVATHLAAAFTNAGHKIVEVWSRDRKNSELLAYHVKATAVGTLNELSPDVELLIIAVKDDAIADIVARLPATKAVVAHTSGSTSIEVLASLEKFGVLYPLQTFSKTKSVDFLNVPVLIEGSTESVVKFLRELASSVSNNVVEADSKKRETLHIAAVFACNFSNYMFSMAKVLTDAKGLDFNLIRPLIAETADKVMKLNPTNAQTGPAVRNDRQTIEKHLEILKDYPDLHNIYRRLSQSIINFYEKP